MELPLESAPVGPVGQGGNAAAPVDPPAGPSMAGVWKLEVEDEDVEKEVELDVDVDVDEEVDVDVEVEVEVEVDVGVEVEHDVGAVCA
jgi:hypothetical protein